MSTLTAREQELFDLAKAALPSWMFSDESNPQELIAAFAKQFAQAWDQVDFWRDQMYLRRAVVQFLADHARDRGTRQQSSESVDALRVRLRNITDALTKPTLLARVQALLAQAGVAGTPAIMELRPDGAKLVTRQVLVLCPDASHILDGETVTFQCAGTTTTFEFDYNGSVIPGHVAVNLVVGYNASQVASALYVAINGTSLRAGFTGRTPGEIRVYYNADPTRVIESSEAVADPLFVLSPGHRRAYCGRGYRLMQQTPRLIVELPYGTPAAVGTAVAEDLRQYAAAGVQITVEIRGVP